MEILITETLLDKLVFNNIIVSFEILDFEETPVIESSIKDKFLYFFDKLW